MVTQIQKEPIGRNILIVKDLTGVSTTDASETNLFVNGDGYTIVANGYIDMGVCAGCTVYVEFTETDGAAGTLKSYGAMTAATTYQYSAASNQAISASTTSKYTILNCPQFLRLTITRTAGDITVKYKVTAYAIGGTL
jgi:hypothetical protein